MEESTPDTREVGDKAKGKAALLIQHKVQPDETFNLLVTIKGFKELGQDPQDRMDVHRGQVIMEAASADDAEPRGADTVERGQPGGVG